jgi:hypothetical protein
MMAGLRAAFLVTNSANTNIRKEGTMLTPNVVPLSRMPSAHAREREIISQAAIEQPITLADLYWLQEEIDAKRSNVRAAA